ncbi:MAG: hypothetical protein J6B71_02040 [Clostridia bacterium]|nr:hypothetical protein [Clostridia bacterium]
MKKALVELWNGNRFPLSNHLKQTEEEKKLMEQLATYHSAMVGKLDNSEKENLKRLADCYSELLATECENAFVKGFSLAVRLISEALT